MKLSFKNLTVQVVIGILLGIAIGFMFPEFGAKLKVLADIFIKLIKMVIAPIIFLTVVIGIGSMGDLKKVGRIGGKALLYFEIVTTFALAIGIIVVNFIKPGAGFNINGASGADVTQYTQQAAEAEHGFMEFIMGIIPDSVFGAMANGELLPILFFAVLFGMATATLGEKAAPVITFFACIKEEILLVLGTSSSESALPKMMDKMEKYGCSKSVVGLVIPTGYSFNLDGTAIYLSM